MTPRRRIAGSATVTALVAGAATIVALLALASSAHAAAAPEPRPLPSGATGTVTVVPHPCPFYGCEGDPIGATVIAYRGTEIVAKTRTVDGRYKLGLLPSTYTLVARPWAREYAHRIRCKPVEVHVPWGTYLRADIFCRRVPATARG